MVSQARALAEAMLEIESACLRARSNRDADGIDDAASAGIDKVGIFVSPTSEELETAVATVRLDVVQIHGSLPATLPEGVRLWRALPVADDFRFRPAGPNVEAYLLDTPDHLGGGSGRTFNWNLAAIDSARIVLAGGLEASNVRAAIRTARPWGVDACSRLESAPGRKDPQKVKAFVEAARAAFYEAQGFSSANEALVKETV